MTPAQCRAARAILDLTQPSLAELAGLSISTLVDFEKGRRPVPAPTRDRIRQALEEKGAIFLAENGDGPGVRLRKAPAQAIDAKGPATDAVRAMDAAIEKHEAAPAAPRRPELEVVSLPGALMGPHPDMRRPDAAKVKMLAASIADGGLPSPIIVAPGKRIRCGTKVDGWDILAGLDRFTAMFEVLNWREIPCVVYKAASDIAADLVTVDETLMRHDLSAADRAEQMARREELHEALHPKGARGSIGGGQSRPTRRKTGRSPAKR